ncbi:MAG: FAD-dependent oxidoreductase, partial [Bryobacteraceae bacterium]
MPEVIVIGGGLAGLASAAALGEAGFGVELLEARGFLGGRATSYPLMASGGDVETIDNCQHILLRCCVNLLDLYQRLNVGDRIRFYREFYFLEPGGRMSKLAAGVLPAPLHFAESFFKLRFLSAADKIAVGRAIAALRREWRSRPDLDRITML